MRNNQYTIKAIHETRRSVDAFQSPNLRVQPLLDVADELSPLVAFIS